MKECCSEVLGIGNGIPACDGLEEDAQLELLLLAGVERAICLQCIYVCDLLLRTKLVIYKQAKKTGDQRDADNTIIQRCVVVYKSELKETVIRVKTITVGTL